MSVSQQQSSSLCTLAAAAVPSDFCKLFHSLHYLLQDNKYFITVKYCLSDIMSQCASFFNCTQWTFARPSMRMHQYRHEYYSRSRSKTKESGTSALFFVCICLPYSDLHRHDLCHRSVIAVSCSFDLDFDPVKALLRLLFDLDLSGLLVDRKSL